MPKRRAPRLTSPVLRYAAAAAIVALTAVGLTQVVAAGKVAPGEAPIIVEHREGALRLVYHVPTGLLGLYDTQQDPGCVENLAPSRVDDAARLRRTLEQRLGYRLEQLHAGDRTDDEMRAIRSLGYL